MIYRQRKLRHEYKYIISQGQYAILKQRFSALLKLDKNSMSGGYRITSLYFDDIYRSGYNDKLAGEQVRKKYRIRAYNLDSSIIKLECKHKDNEYISKRSVTLSKEQYYQILGGDYSLGINPEYADTTLESLYVSNSLARVKPTVLVDYYREAFVSASGNVRFTFDSKLSTSYQSLDMFSKNTIFSPVLGNQIVLELKYDEFLPSYLLDIIQGVGLEKQPVSKFLICQDAMSAHHNVRL